MAAHHKGGALQGNIPLVNQGQIALVAQVRAVLLEHSGGGVKGLSHVFKKLDFSGRKKVDANDLQLGLKNYKINLSAAEASLLVQAFDRAGDGTVTYDEFVEGVKGEMNATRKAICMRAYSVMDVTKDGKVDMADIRKLYNAKFDPRVKNGAMTEDAVLLEFLHVFEGVKGNRDGVVSPEEWIDYYSSVSASIDSDVVFVSIIKSAWKLDEYAVGEVKKATASSFDNESYKKDAKKP